MRSKFFALAAVFFAVGAGWADAQIAPIPPGNLPLFTPSARGAVPPPGSVQGYVLTDSGSWVPQSGGGGGSPSGSVGALQFNNTGAFGGLGLGTSTTVLHGNASGAPTYGAVNLATDVTGTLSATSVTGLAPVATSGSAGDLSTGTLAPARMPLPSATTIGGVQSAATVTHQWMNGISTSGVPSLSQPAWADISGNTLPTGLTYPSPTMTGTTTTAGVIDSGGINTTAATGFSQQGNTIVTTCCNSSNLNLTGPQAVTRVGVGAGANFNANEPLATVVGYGAAGSWASSTLPGFEGTAVGIMSQHNLNNPSSSGFNTTLGVFTLYNCVTCTDDIAIGTDSMKWTTTESGSIGIGGGTLIYSASAGPNIAIGTHALQGGPNNSTPTLTGVNNIAIGTSILLGSAATLTTAHDNVLIGNQVGNGTTTTASTPSQNVIVGSFAGGGMTTDSNNVFVGYEAGYAQAGSSSSNIFVGARAGWGCTTCFNNVMMGSQSSNSTITTGSNSVIIGYQSIGLTSVLSPTVDGQIAIGGVIFANGGSGGRTQPTPSACGTSPSADARANSKSGTITPGTGSPTSCTVTFGVGAYRQWAHCVVTPETAVSGFSYAKSGIGASNFVLTVTAGAGLGPFDYVCEGL